MTTLFILKICLLFCLKNSQSGSLLLITYNFSLFFQQDVLFVKEVIYISDDEHTTKFDTRTTEITTIKRKRKSSKEEIMKKMKANCNRNVPLKNDPCTDLLVEMINDITSWDVKMGTPSFSLKQTITTYDDFTEYKG